MSKEQKTEPKVTVVVPNYNGMAFIRQCLDSLRKQNFQKFHVIVVDNGSTDGSLQVVQEEYQEFSCIALTENTGFCGAVNRGIKASQSPYVLLLNNDTIVDEEFINALYQCISSKKQCFSVSSKMLQLADKTKIDDAGNFYCALGWAFARGKDKSSENYDKPGKIFSSCAGAAIYRRDIFEKIGYFDEAHFAYLEDLDVGYRARIEGYYNYYEPKAIVYHAGSGTSGSRYNQFKISHSARNNIYVIYKNMPLLQILINLPLLITGVLVKTTFFMLRGYGKEYVKGIKNGFVMSTQYKKQKVRFSFKKLPNYFCIQIELWVNILRKAFDL